MIPFSYLLDFSNFTNMYWPKNMFLKVWKSKNYKGPRGIRCHDLQIRSWCSKPLGYAFGNKFRKEKIMKSHSIYFNRKYFWITTWRCPIYHVCKSFCLHFGFKLNFNSCLGFLYHFSFADHSVYALSVHFLFHLPLVSVCSMLSDGWESSMFQGL